MAVEVEIISQKYLNQSKNGLDFSLDTSDTTPNMIGAVGEKIKFTQTINVKWFARGDDTYYWTVYDLGGDLYKIEREAGSFINDGIAIGDNVNFLSTDYAGSTTYTNDGDITMVTDLTCNIQLSVASTPQNTGQLSSGLLIGKSPVTALIYSYGVIQNSDSFNILSLTTGEDQQYYSKEIGLGSTRSTDWVDMIAKSPSKSWVDGTARARYIQTIGIYTQQFEIEHTFIIPYYKDGDLFNLLNNIVRDSLKGENSYKYVYSTDFRTSLSNPNTSKYEEVDLLLGAVGDYGENLNGFLSDYQLESVSYKNTATSDEADALLITSKTTATIEISRISGAITTDNVAIPQISYIPDDTSEFIDTTTDLETNFMLDNIRVAIGSNEVGTGIITAVRSSIVSDNAVIEVDIEFTTAQQEILTGDSYYLLTVNIGDNSLTAPNSDRVALKMPIVNFDLSADISGLMSVNKFDIFPHNKTIGVDTGSTNLTAWNEDGVSVDFNFELDLNKSAVLNDLKFLVLAYNAVDGVYFLLDQYNYDLSNTIITPDTFPTQQIDIDTERNYPLVEGSQFNTVELTTGVQAAGVQEYDGKIGQKTPWQDWIANDNVNAIFYDKTKLNNNFNNKTSNYSGLNNYDIKLGFIANLTGIDDIGNSGETDYLFISPTIVVYDYDNDANVIAVWSGVIETYRNSSMTPLGTSVLSGEDTFMKITWTNSLGTVTELNDTWAIHRLEVTNQKGFEIKELSTLRDYPTNNILKPKDTESYLDIYIDCGYVITECIIDGSKVNEGDLFNLSGRIGSDFGSPVVVTPNCFVTNNNFSVNGVFDPSIVNSDGLGVWDLGDGSPIIETDAVSYSGYTDSSEKTFCVSVNDVEAVTEIDFISIEMVGNVDISRFTKLTKIEMRSNSELTGITNPINSEAITNYSFYDCNLTGVLDVSMLTGLGGVFDVHNNPLLTSITNPTSSEIFTIYWAYDCNLTGTLDLSGLTGLGGVFIVRGNPLLTAVINPTTSQTFTSYHVYNCAVSFIDFTTMTNLTNNTTCSIKIENNGMSAANVDQILIDLDSISVGGYGTARFINIAGSNAAPTATSAAAIANLIANGFTLYTN